MITAVEYQPIVRGRDIDTARFDQISVLAREMEGNGRKLFNYSYVSGELAIVPQNYVGVIAFKGGENLEILPKVTILDDDVSKARVKEVFLKMLLRVFDMSSEETGVADLGVWGSNPYEFFVRMFTREVSDIVSKGIRSGYSETEGNERFIRGRIIFSEDIKLNSFHRERTYQSYQIFDTDRAENRLIRATLRYLRTVTGDYVNRKEIHRLLPYFENCSDVRDVDAEFARCIAERNMKHYARALKWCDIFLHNQSFSTFSGSDVAYTFLFPMERVFESFVARTLSDNLVDCDVSVQDTSMTMFDTGIKRQVRPDIVIRRDGMTQVFDTKWKIISSDDDISDADLRQMKEYSADFKGPATLLYPKVEYCSESVSTRGDIVVKTKYIDLLNHFDDWWANLVQYSLSEQ